MWEDYKILVTVGTTAFDSLIRYLDTKYYWPNALYQIGPGSYIPKKHKYYRFIDNIENEYDKYDVVLCHAGAGTIYNCLERGIKLIVVPNLERRDKHQIEISDYLRKNNYALVVENFVDLESVLQQVMNYKSNPYIRETFIARDFILDEISKVL
jgi:beta-1,4-N-acetylglucosaminyltransferase